MIGPLVDNSLHINPSNQNQSLLLLLPCTKVGGETLSTYAQAFEGRSKTEEMYEDGRKQNFPAGVSFCSHLPRPVKMQQKKVHASPYPGVNIDSIHYDEDLGGRKEEMVRKPRGDVVVVE